MWFENTWLHPCNLWILNGAYNAIWQNPFERGNCQVAFRYFDTFEFLSFLLEVLKLRVIWSQTSQNCYLLCVLNRRNLSMNCHDISSMMPHTVCNILLEKSRKSMKITYQYHPVTKFNKKKFNKKNNFYFHSAYWTDYLLDFRTPEITAPIT